MKPVHMLKSFFAVSLLLGLSGNVALAAKGARSLTAFGYENCIELKNKTTRVVLTPSGGRVLAYEINGVNTLYLSESDSQGKGGSSAGRFDIGPERVLPRHDLLWSGPYEGEITGARSARFTSGKDEATGFQIVRDFRLAAKGTHLRIKQTVINISDKTRQVCYWCRTFVHGQGICVVPVTEHSRMPRKHVIYENGTTINFLPDDEKISQRDGYVLVEGPPRMPKLGFDSKSGWMAYLMRNDLLFVKGWPTYPKRPYNEMAGFDPLHLVPRRPDVRARADRPAGNPQARWQSLLHRGLVGGRAEIPRQLQVRRPQPTRSQGQKTNWPKVGFRGEGSGVGGAWQRAIDVHCKRFESIDHP